MTHEILTQSYDEYRKLLRDLGMPNNEVDNCITHERAHFETALKLGYNPVYGAVYSPRFQDSKPLVLHCFVGFIGKKPTSKELIEICLAPSDPGLLDRTMAAVERARQYSDERSVLKKFKKMLRRKSK